MKALEAISCEKWLNFLGLSNLEKRRLRKVSGDAGTDLSSLVFTNRTHGKGSKLHQGRFRVDIRKHLFTERVAKHCKRFSREVVDAP